MQKAFFLAYFWIVYLKYYFTRIQYELLETSINEKFLIENSGVNMGYMENSYSNSNNGGSVNSQDSLWQLKMSAAAGNSANLIPTHNYVERYYGTVDDYATYPTQQMPDEYQYNNQLINSQNPSRQDYCSDPYAAVHKPKKRLDQQHLGKS